MQSNTRGLAVAFVIVFFVHGSLAMGHKKKLAKAALVGAALIPKVIPIPIPLPIR